MTKRAEKKLLSLASDLWDYSEQAYWDIAELEPSDALDSVLSVIKEAAALHTLLSEQVELEKSNATPKPAPTPSTTLIDQEPVQFTAVRQ